MNSAKKIRLNRFLNPHSKKGIIIPIDHGLTMGPLEGIESVGSIRPWIHNENINGIIAHKGMIERLANADLLSNKGVMMHVNGMAAFEKQSDSKELLAEVDTAVRLGVDAISLQLNFTDTNLRENLIQLGKIADRAYTHNLPLLLMLYNKSQIKESGRIQRMQHLMRIAIELGVDAIKIALPNSNIEQSALLSHLSEDVLVFPAGGEIIDESRFVEKISEVISYGASGICVGRNVFGRENPHSIIDKLAETIHFNNQKEVPKHQRRLQHGYH